MLSNNELISALNGADEEFLTGLANKGIYKRACKDIEGAAPQYTEEGASAVVSIGGESVKVCVPLNDSKCSCPSRTVCRHVIAAILLLKKEAPEGVQAEEKPKAEPPKPAPKPKKAAPEKEPVAENTEDPFITGKEALKVRETALTCKTLLDELLKRGLVRMPESSPEDLELAAVRCHSNKMASAEKLMRELGSRLGDCLARRAAFSPEEFTHRLCEAQRLLDRLSGEKILKEDMGTFRRSYGDFKGSLTILPIGMREVNIGDYEGEVYYFLNMDETAVPRFLTFSDLRPVFYDTVAPRRRPQTTPWGLGVPLRSLMKTKMTLIGAKISGDKLSSSQETEIVAQSKASLNCPEVHRLVIDDFRQIAVELDGRDEGLEDLFFIHPEKCRKSTFDKYEQEYVMVLEDWRGCKVRMKAKYRAETKAFIEQLEAITDKMAKDNEKYFTLLVSAKIVGGELTLFPIEVYDFIIPTDERQYILPEKYDDIESDAAYAIVLQNVFDEVEASLCSMVQCGLQSDIRNDGRLIKLLKSCGLKGLEERVGELLARAAGYRHSTYSENTNVLKDMAEIFEYIKLGRRQLGTVSALDRMTNI